MNTVTLLCLLITVSVLLSKAKSHEAGFTLDLIHRDSSLSPLYNPTLTPSQRLKNAFLHSISRAARLSKKAGLLSKIDADIVASVFAGEYLMFIQIGNPPVQVLAIADTGSDLSWVQCQPCSHCYNQTLFPILQPNASSTYQLLSCQSKPCEALVDVERPCESNQTCVYQMTYGDQSSSIGDLARDTFWFGQTSLDNVVFGCGHENLGTFSKDSSGIIGLGGGPLSLVTQLSNVVQGRFSYCLAPLINNTTPIKNKIHFGHGAHVTGDNVVSTPMVKKDPSTFYYVTLETVLVGNSSSYRSFWKKDVDEGNIIIDSGTTLTYIPPDFHKGLISALTSAIGGDSVQDPQGILDLCYKGLDLERVPAVTFRFTGADVVLPAENTFLEVEEGVHCLTMVSSASQGLAIFGNLQQKNYLIGFDLGQRSISFLPTDCSKYAIG